MTLTTRLPDTPTTCSHYTGIRLRLPLVKMFGDASYSMWNENLYSH